MYALIDFRNHIERKQDKLQGRAHRMSWAMFRLLHRAGDGRVGYVVMSAQGIVNDVVDYHTTVTTHRAEIFAWQGNRVLLRHGETFAWWDFEGDEMVVIEYMEAGQAA